MAKSDDLQSLLDTMQNKYQLKDKETQLEFLGLHLLASEPGVADAALDSSTPMDVDLSDYWTGGSGDQELDGILFDLNENFVIMIQATSRAKWSEDVAQKASSFFAKLRTWETIARGDEVDGKVNAKTLDLLKSCGIAEGEPTIKLVFLTDLATGQGGPANKLNQIAENATKDYNDQGKSVQCEVLGRAEILASWEQMQNQYSLAGVSYAEINIGQANYFELTSPKQTLVVALNTNELKGLFNQSGVKNRLFNSNVRMALGGKSKINKGISQSLSGQPESFFYFNNGVTATCSKYELSNSGRLVMTNLSIVNGAQTVSTIGTAPQTSEPAYLLFRLIATGESYQKKNDFPDLVTKFQNTQNPVKASDFFSNEPLQLWLSQNLAERAQKFNNCAAFWYAHKRGYEAKRSTGQRVDLETLAKLRHSCYHGPHVSYNAPKDFWDDSMYWQVFGTLEGEKLSAWNEEQIAEMAWAITSFLELRSLATKLRRQDNPPEESKYLSYLAIFITSATFELTKFLQDSGKLPDFQEVMRSREAKDRVEMVRSEVRKAVSREIYQRANELESNPKFYMARNDKAFSNLVGFLKDQIKAGLIEI